jgi:hypothetical protein
MAWVTLPNNTRVWCRDCTCGDDTTHTKTCEYYVDFANALTDFVYEDETEPVRIPVKQLN